MESVKYRFGAGRYIQEEYALEQSGEEILRYGKKALILAGPTAWEVSGDRIRSSIEKTTLEWEVLFYRGQACYEAVETYKKQISVCGFDVLVGVGGGRLMDLCKGIASSANVPVVLIPTSCATCACFTPLSVMYTEEGKSVGPWYHDYEVNALIVDDTIMAKQPPRLLAAGILDAMAKFVEIPGGKPCLTMEEDGVDKHSAYFMARYAYEVLMIYGPKAYRDVEQGILTKEVHEVVFTNIALTGIISNLMRGIGQTSIAHNFGAAMHTLYTEDTEAYLHGELVATGMLMQLRWNGTPEKISELRTLMDAFHMPTAIGDYRVENNENIVEKVTEFIAASRFVPHTEEGHASIVEAIKEISQ